MTILDIEDKQGVWFDMEGGGRVQLRVLTADDLKSIKKQTTKKKVEYKRVDGKAERFEIEEVNEELQTELFWDSIIVSWENLKDIKGNDIQCTKANKNLLMSRSNVFAKFVTDSMQQLNQDEAQQNEEAEKN